MHTIVTVEAVNKFYLASDQYNECLVTSLCDVEVASESSTESSVDIVRCAFNNFFHNTICIVGMKVMFLKVF